MLYSLTITWLQGVLSSLVEGTVFLCFSVLVAYSSVLFSLTITWLQGVLLVVRVLPLVDTGQMSGTGSGGGGGRSYCQSFLSLFQ